MSESVEEEVIYVEQVREAPDGEYRDHRPYWVYKVKMSVLTDRWAEALELACRAVEFPAEADGGRDWRVLTRAVEGRLKELREKLNKVQALLYGERSMATKETFGIQAQNQLNRIREQLGEACAKAKTVLDKIDPRDAAGEAAVARLQGDLARYTGADSAATAAYKTSLAKDGELSYNASASKLGLHVVDRGGHADLPRGPENLRPAHLPLLPINLSLTYAAQREAKVALPFTQEELLPPPLTFD